MNKVIALFTIAIVFIACEKNPTIDYEKPDIHLTEVFQIVDENTEVNIYKHKPLIIQTIGAAVTKEVITERSELDDALPFNFTLISEEQKDERIIRELEIEDEEGNVTLEETIIEVLATYTYAYVVVGDKESKTGQAVITTTKVELVGKNISYEEVLEPNTTLIIDGDMSIKQVLN
ncbi:hypothetical protein [Saccharicrinis aurantiacus]|uniref:hypothetical protein n=1 Tax=Saccharicrinis aurantiacus TaxID=1849719 RepID=UPI0024927437|nr:hypothetical protein [Saccharicrinis aurantiacus]